MWILWIFCHALSLRIHNGVLSVYLIIGTCVGLYLERTEMRALSHPLRPRWSGKSVRSKPFAEWWPNAADITGWQLERYPSGLLLNSTMQHQEVCADKSDSVDLATIWAYKGCIHISFSSFDVFRLVISTSWCVLCDCWSPFVQISMWLTSEIHKD